MAENLAVTGFVLWRDEAGQDPAYRYGTLHIRGGTCVQFAPQVAPSSSNHKYVVPGFVDMHAHLAISGQPADSAEITAHAWSQIRAGVLAVREPGSPVKVSLAELPYERPLLITAGRHIAVEKRYIRGLAVELPAGEDSGSRARALAQVISEQSKSSDGWVKLVGDWIDRSAGPSSDLEPLWTGDELREGVRAAHGLGVKVGVHIFGSRGIDELLDAGVDSIEHGSGMSLAQMQKAATQGTVVVPTLIQVLKFPEFADAATRYPKYANTMRELYDRRKEWFTDLLATGVQILPGSDAGGYQSHGALLREMATMVEWGMPVGDVLDAATWRARDFLGLASLSEGAPADAVVFGADPRVHPQIWASPTYVVANGHRVGAG